jgi:hypothetical protein
MCALPVPPAEPCQERHHNVGQQGLRQFARTGRPQEAFDPGQV